MTRLSRFMFILILTLFTLIAGAILAGCAHTNSTQSNPLVLLGFGICKGDPCFRGVISGKTSWNDAKAKLAKYKREELLDQVVGSADGLAFGYGNYSRRSGVSSDHVTTLSFAFYASGLRVSFVNVIELFGQPCQVSFSKDSFTMIYPTFDVGVLKNPNQAYPIGKLNMFALENTMTNLGDNLCEQFAAERLYENGKLSGN